MKPLDEKLLEIKGVQKDLADWEDVKRHGAWQKLIQHLENRYVQLGTTDCDSLRTLAARNSAMKEIRDILSFTKHDFQYQQILLNDIRLLQQDEDEIPDKPIYFG